MGCYREAVDRMDDEGVTPVVTQETYDQLTQIMREVFKDASISAAPEMTAKDVDRWDSLGHIRFILQVERRFAVKFSTTEISRFKNVGELADLIIKKKAQ